MLAVLATWVLLALLLIWGLRLAISIATGQANQAGVHLATLVVVTLAALAGRS